MPDTVKHTGNLILTGGEAPRLDIDALAALTAKPSVFAPGQPLFWDDPHISSQMLKAHLSPVTDAASRRPETIDATVDWLMERIELSQGCRLLDLGCGPGLYAQRLAARGLAVTGVDFSRRSIAYARAQAAAQGLDIAYVCQDYLTIDYSAQFDAALMIYYDLGVFGDDDRDRLLSRIAAALKPGGRFAFDVMTREGRVAARADAGWYASQGGFWRPGPHLVLTRVHQYPEHAAELDEYLVIEADGAVTVYRVWHRHYTPATIAAALAPHGFVVEDVYADLTAHPYCGSGPGLGIIARRT